MTSHSRYRRTGHRTVDGWLEPLAIVGIVALAQSQSERGITGSVAEIGVHHGRLFILLHLLSRPDEVGVAWDLFENQTENIDNSGSGDRAQFVRNLNRHGCATQRIKIVATNSLDLTPVSALATTEAKVRLFSVDGGHTADITCHDLALAAAVSCNGGLVILDDCFNESWPGVSEGVSRYMKTLADAKDQGAQEGIFPFAIFGNKLLFTTSTEFAALYQETLNRLPGNYFKQYANFYGNRVLSLVPAKPRYVREYLSRLPVWLAVKNSGFGQWIKYSALNRWFG